jgi:hypothetical protein
MAVTNSNDHKKFETFSKENKNGTVEMEHYIFQISIRYIH